jgi:hypothetical protein
VPRDRGGLGFLTPVGGSAMPAPTSLLAR